MLKSIGKQSGEEEKKGYSGKVQKRKVKAWNERVGGE